MNRNQIENICKMVEEDPTRTVEITFQRFTVKRSDGSVLVSGPIDHTDSPFHKDERKAWGRTTRPDQTTTKSKTKLVGTRLALEEYEEPLFDDLDLLLKYDELCKLFTNPDVVKSLYRSGGKDYYQVEVAIDDITGGKNIYYFNSRGKVVYGEEWIPQWGPENRLTGEREILGYRKQDIKFQ